MDKSIKQRTSFYRTSKVYQNLACELEIEIPYSLNVHSDKQCRSFYNAFAGLWKTDVHYLLIAINFVPYIEPLCADFAL